MSGGQHGFWREHPLEEGQLAVVLRRLGPFDHVAASQPTSEPDPDPAAGHRLPG